MTAVDYPALVRGVVIAAAAASKQYDLSLRAEIDKAGDASLPSAVRLAALRKAFFAPSSDPTAWLQGWHPRIREAQRAAAAAVAQSAWWSGGTAPLLDLQADRDPFRAADTRLKMKAEFGDRVTVAVIPDASHALFPEQPQLVSAALADWIRRLPMQ
jgi:pimeloyl-ACP methyl ester carboxylesterase